MHFIDVGCGNMVLAVLPSGKVLVYDCNITEENTQQVLSYLSTIISDKSIDIFVNSHRDADHMRGIHLLHEAHPISTIWDSGEPGTTTDSPEYEVYMDILRRVATKEVQARKYWELGEVMLRCLNSRWPDYSDPNEQSIVMKVEYRGSSVMLGGDTNYRPWKEKILPFYDANKLLSSIFYAPHHGALTFFDDPSDTKYYFIDHIKKINPAMTLISVGPNIHGLPDKKAIGLYEKHSTGSDKGNKVYTTEAKGNMKLTLKEDGGWSLNVNQ